MEVVQKSVGELIPYARNARTHSQAQVAKIASSIREFGWTNPILLDGENGVLAGHGRLAAAQVLGMEAVPCIELGHLSDVQKRAYVLADNKIAAEAGWDVEMLKLEIEELTIEGFDLELTGFDDLDTTPLEEQLSTPGASGDDASQSSSSDDAAATPAGKVKGALSERFLVPPFSVLNAREGWWADRKRAWIELGIRSELGRESGLAFSASSQPWEVYEAKRLYSEKMGREYKWNEFRDECPEVFVQSGTSTFDPVVCEIAYRWFCPVGGTILDPFAGGSVRGVVAAKLGRKYLGCDLRSEQVEANVQQWQSIKGGGEEAEEPSPTWHCGDSLQIAEHFDGELVDFVFSCPPYADLEVYSDDPADLSTMAYPEFIAAYEKIIAETCSLLKEDRFACFVVGDVRDKHGNYYNFVGDTVEAFRKAGLHYYNEGILVTQIGSLAMRAGRFFTAGRKFGKTHQNILVFVKGDGKRATSALGEVDVTMPDGLIVDGGHDGD